MANVLTIGCGAIGHQLGVMLARKGHSVTGLKRNPSIEAHSAFNYYRADICVPESLAELKSDFDYIYFIVSAGSRIDSNYHDIYEVGLGNVLKKFTSANSNPCWIFVSSTSVYGQHRGEWVDEDSPTEPEKATSLEIVKAEQRLIAHNPGNIIVRFSGIYGPGREYLLRMAQKSPAIQKSPPYFTNRIHQDDCVGVLAFLLEQCESGANLEQCYLASDDNPAPMWDVISWLAGQMSFPPPVEKAVGKDGGQNKRCRNNRLKKLGYHFKFPDYMAGYTEMLNQCKGSFEPG